MNTQVKALYDEARGVYDQAMEIRNRFKGNDIPAEELDRLNALMDQVEEKTNAAKSLERADQFSGMFEGAGSNIPLGNGGAQSKGTPSITMTENVKALSQMTGFGNDMVTSPLTVEGISSYDPDREMKHRIASAMLWKYGMKDFDTALKRLPRDLQGLATELKDLATAPGAAGGYVTSNTQLTRLIELQADVIAMRRLATVLPPIPGGSAITPSEDTELSDPAWTSEIGTGADDTVFPFGQRMLTPHPLAKRIKISRTLLRAATLLDVEGFVLNRMARKFNEAEENSYVNGDGNQKPQGLLSAAITAVIGATSVTLEPNDLINWAYQLPAAYARRAAILCNRSFIRKVRLLRDESGGAGTGQYMWQPGLSSGNPPTILDWRYELSDMYPTGLTNDVFDANAVVATIGDFSYYWIVDSLNFEVQRLEELYAATNQVGFIGRKETDGMVVNVDAFRNLKIKA